MLEDIAILTGGKAVTEDLGIKLENVRIENLKILQDGRKVKFRLSRIARRNRSPSGGQWNSTPDNALADLSKSPQKHTFSPLH
jgi:hypothetical protein